MAAPISTPSAASSPSPDCSRRDLHDHSVGLARRSPAAGRRFGRWPVPPDSAGRGFLGKLGRKTYVAAFDPGTLSGPTPMSALAKIGDTSLADDQVNLDVQPLPDWIKALKNSDPPKFTPDSIDDGGTYTFKGFWSALASQPGLLSRATYPFWAAIYSGPMWASACRSSRL